MLFNEREVNEIVHAYVLVRKTYGQINPNPYSKEAVKLARTAVENFDRVVPKDLVNVIGDLHTGELEELRWRSSRPLEQTVG